MEFPILAMPTSMHFFTSIQPLFTDKTLVALKFDLSVCADASEFPAGSSDLGQGIIKLFYGLISTQPGSASQSFQPPALPSLVHSYQQFSFPTMAAHCTWHLLLSLFPSLLEIIKFIATLIKKLHFGWIGHFTVYTQTVSEMLKLILPKHSDSVSSMLNKH